MTLKKATLSFLSICFIFALTLFGSLQGAPDHGIQFSNPARAMSGMPDKGKAEASNKEEEEEGLRGISCKARLKIANKKYTEEYKCPESEHEKCEKLKKSIDKLNKKCGEPPKEAESPKASE